MLSHVNVSFVGIINCYLFCTFCILDSIDNSTRLRLTDSKDLFELKQVYKFLWQALRYIMVHQCRDKVGLIIGGGGGGKFRV